MLLLQEAISSHQLEPVSTDPVSVEARLNDYESVVARRLSTDPVWWKHD